MLDFFAFQVRPRVLYKTGLVNELEHEVERLGQRALIVCDEGIVQTGLLDQVRAGLGNKVEVVGVFSAVPAHSSVEAVERGADYARSVSANLVIAVGGGSPLDTAKCMRMLLVEGGRLHDYEGHNLIDRPLTPLVAIPTTAGTGSEVTPFAVIHDEAARRKLTFASQYLAPDLAILDPEMTRSLPPQLTAATGMDALSHAIEAFVSKEANWISDSLGLQTIDTISNNLRAATFTGDDMGARGLMMIAACMGGMAFANSFVGIIHAIAHTIGGSYAVHHGIANAILLPHGMRFNSTAAPNRFSRIARAMGVNAGGRAEEDVIEDGIAAVAALAADCALPSRLRDVGVPEAALPDIAEGALTDGAIFTNPRAATAEDILALLHAAW